MHNFKFSRLKVEFQEVIAWKQYQECFVRVMKLPKMATHVSFDEISNHVLTHFLQQVSVY